MLPDFLNMCFQFFKAGLFSLGGGIVTIPFMTELAEKYTWFTQEDVADMIAISEATPGPFGMNMATYAGYKAYGILGSIGAVFSMALSPFVIIIIVCKFLDKFSENTYVIRALKGIKPAVCVLILSAWLSIAEVTLVNMDLINEGIFSIGFYKIVPIILFLIIFIGNRFDKKISPIFWIIFGAICGAIFL